MNLYGYVESNPVNIYDPLGLMPVPKKDQKYRPCNSAEVAKCAASCKYGMDTCMVSQIFQSGVLQGKVVKKGQLSCSCKEPDCWDKLKEWTNPKKWFDPNPAPPLIPIAPSVSPSPVPVGAFITGLVPFVNPCLFGDFPGCGGDSGRR
jgi:hypothetical protein